jgi:hypothetical protein
VQQVLQPLQRRLTPQRELLSRTGWSLLLDSGGHVGFLAMRSRVVVGGNDRRR